MTQYQIYSLGTNDIMRFRDAEVCKKVSYEFIRDNMVEVKRSVEVRGVEFIPGDEWEKIMAFLNKKVDV